VGDQRPGLVDGFELPSPQVTGRDLARFRGPPRDDPPLLELDDVIRAIAAHREGHGEHITHRPHTLAGRRVRQVVIAIPSRLLRWIGDQFENLVRWRRDLAARSDDRKSHMSIQQHLDSDKFEGHSRA
jgi:hypothetical protein